MKKTLTLALIALVFCSCGGQKGTYTFDEKEAIYTPKYARGFEIYSLGESSVLKITNPWQGAQGVSSMVFISRGGEVPPEGFDGVVLSGEMGKIGCMSSSHIAFIDALGHVDAVCAVSGLRYITNPAINEMAAKGRIRDVGYEGNIDYETLAVLRPDVVFMYSVAGERLPIYDKLKELNIPVVMIGEYLEADPLGKAEWIVAFGEIFGCHEMAEEIFAQVESGYLSAKQMAASVMQQPKVMLNAPWKDTWFVPGDRSYMVKLIADAGGEYVCAGVDSEQSRAINGETAYLYAKTADYWLNPNEATSIAQLTRDNPNFADIPAVAARKVYNNNLRSTTGGGSDFWETGAVYPNVVLRDMIAILHPELCPEHDLYYFRKLE